MQQKEIHYMDYRTLCVYKKKIFLLAMHYLRNVNREILGCYCRELAESYKR